jgi:hypothetical protein
MAEPQRNDGDLTTGDPVADLILRGEAASVEEAEEIYLNTHMEEVLRLVDSPLSDEEFRRHPLIALLLARGSRAWEDSLW